MIHYVGRSGFAVTFKIEGLLYLIKNGQATKAASISDSVLTSHELVLSCRSFKTEETQL